MRHERLAYSIQEAAAMLGGVSARSVQRLIARGVLPCVRIGRRVLVGAETLRSFIARSDEVPHNPPRAEPVAWKGTKPCYSNAQSRSSGTSGTGMQAARELSGLLEQLTGGKRRSLKRSGG